MPVIRPRIPAVRILLRSEGRLTRPLSMRGANRLLSLKAQVHPGSQASYDIEWADGRLARGTITLDGTVQLAAHIDDAWTRPPTMADDEYKRFIREKTTLRYSGGWPLSKRLEETPRYDVGREKTIEDIP